jgi:hypothetical protein
VKRSTRVPLLIMGALTLAMTGCNNTNSPDEIDVKQNHYASKADCQEDWGPDDRNCTQSSGHGSSYMGPRYILNNSGGSPLAVGPEGRTRPLENNFVTRGGSSTAKSTSVSRVGYSSISIARGGFGSTAHGFSVGG